MEARILIVDDSRAVVESLTHILSGQGYSVENRNDGESGWRRLLEAAERKAPMPDLLLLDLNMPGIDGLTLLRRLRSDERFALLPVIFLTVEANADIRMEALETGANDYLNKPVQALELLARVKTITSWKLAERSQQHRMECLIEAGRNLLATPNLDQVLQRVLRIGMDEIDAERGTVWLKGTDGRLECRAAMGSGAERLVRRVMAPGQGIVGWAIQNRQSVLVPNVQADLEFYRQLDDQISLYTRDIVAVPFIVRGIPVGILEMINKKQDAFSPADQAWLEVLASLAAAAIANAQIFQVLQQRTIQLQVQNEELDAFAHTVAHDLKAPLSTIVGFAETLAEAHTELPDDDLSHYLNKITQNGHKMRTIVDALLLLAGVRRMKVELEPLHMGTIVAEAMHRLSDIIEESQAEIILPETWPESWGYGPWIEEVWTNYLSNAIKYGGQPPRIELGGGVQSNDQMRFWIRDNGSGLSPEARSRLFIPFTRLERVDAEGHGLGLSIVERIISKLGGKVGVESELGQGSTFFFTLPREAKREERSPL
jgi:signal transduction histidine kinase/ActR/RegA family two-component response regulator